MTPRHPVLIIFNPGVISLLATALRTSAGKGTTQLAVLCRDTTHIKGVWNFDLGRSLTSFIVSRCFFFLLTDN